MHFFARMLRYQLSVRFYNFRSSRMIFGNQINESIYVVVVVTLSLPRDGGMVVPSSPRSRGTLHGLEQKLEP